MILREILRSMIKYGSKSSIFTSVVQFQIAESQLLSRSLSTQDSVLSEKIGAVQVIAINRPEKRNAINRATAEKLYDAVVQFDEDPDTKAAVLYGKGGTFCSGYDLSELSTHSSDSMPLEDLSPSRGPMGPTKTFTKKPVIAAIEGYAVAGGLELALWCDLRVMEETAVLGVFCRRFGVPLVDGGTVRLPKLIGLSRALDLILTGREVKAKEALEIGLVHRVCDSGSAVGRALLLAQEVAKFPAECMKADRHSAYYGCFDAPSMRDALDYEFKGGVTVIEKESIAGAKNFMSGIGRHGSFNLNKKHDIT